MEIRQNIRRDQRREQIEGNGYIREERSTLDFNKGKPLLIAVKNANELFAIRILNYVQNIEQEEIQNFNEIQRAKLEKKTDNMQQQKQQKNILDVNIDDVNQVSKTKKKMTALRFAKYRKQKKIINLLTSVGAKLDGKEEEE
ncbi:MAG: hypothetical protein EZS28_010966 [Streblomastix strix]|uniref:Uncharacterized protein n=1 Tax=Streblomastix strix TaxID=222440 RepID=A0A5J4WEU6_9EUKA|nr:MAG: hypothetical protein EZS28_010966 [Streblomastix strix]